MLTRVWRGKQSQVDIGINFWKGMQWVGKELLKDPRP